MNDVEDLLTSYHLAITEIRIALKKAGLSDREIILETINLPEFELMLPEDAHNLYKEFKTKFILYLSKTLKLSSREIETRLRGDSYGTVNQIVKANRDLGKRVSISEVSKKI